MGVPRRKRKMKIAVITDTVPVGMNTGTGARFILSAAAGKMRRRGIPGWNQYYSGRAV